MIKPETYRKALKLSREYGDGSEPMVIRYDAVEAAYWHLTEWHAGQWSPEYAELSWLTGFFSPGYTDGPDAGSVAAMIFDELEMQAKGGRDDHA